MIAKKHMILAQRDSPATIGLARQVLTAVPDSICQLSSTILPAFCLLGPSEAAAAGMGSHHFCTENSPRIFSADSVTNIP